MIKFFRKIRQQLLATGKTGTYLKYALGEIILVVIGILIALYINNLNEARKTKANEIQIYKNAILDLREEAKSVSTNIKWFKGFQDTYYKIYQERHGIPGLDSIAYSSLIWSNFFRPIIDEKYGDNLDKIGSETIQNLFRDLIWREKLTIESMNEWNENKINIVRPFLRMHGIANVDSIYKDKKYEFMKLKGSSFIDVNRLKAQYGTKAFDQILYDGKYKSSWVLRCLENLKVANENLIVGLEAIINDDRETLENIQSIESYY